MLRVAILILLLPAVAAAQKVTPCAFVASQASLAGDSSQGMRAVQPTWFTVSGRAEIEISGNTLRAKFFASGSENEVSHTFSATLASGPPSAGTRTRIPKAILKKLGTDGSDEVLSGESLAVPVDDGPDKYMHRSITTHTAGALVGISCYAKRAA